MDSDWANDREDRKSITGYVICLAGGAVSWRSKKQTCVTLSTVEAEYLALSDVVRDGLWLGGLMESIGHGNFVDKPTKIKMDNQGAVALAKNKSVSERSKHIAVKFHFIRDHIHKDNIQL